MPSNPSSSDPPTDAKSTPATQAPAVVKKRPAGPPPGNTGTHWTGPNEYLLAAAKRANLLKTRKAPLTENAESLAVQLQRFVHHEGNRPPNRLILLHLRLLTLYPPCPDILPELITLLASENAHICRLAHYHIRQIAPIQDMTLYRELVEALEAQVVLQSPARRAAATKTLAKVFVPVDVSRAIDFVSDVFKCIGGARVKDASEIVEKRKVAGVTIPGTNTNKEYTGSSSKDKSKDSEKDSDSKKKKKRNLPKPLLRGQVVTGETAEEEEEARTYVDDGAGGQILDARGSAAFIKSRFGKMLVGHSVYGALRRINRVASDACKVESYFFDSGLMSVVPSTVRHCIALLEIRSTRSPGPVSKYMSTRLPHKNPPAHKKIQLDDLGAKVYFARMLGSLAEDPDLAAHLPDTSSRRPKRQGMATAVSAVRAEALAGDTVKQKASNLFKFLFNKDRISDISASVRSTSTALSTQIRARPRGKVVDSIGVEFAEALINLMKNSSNRVLFEILRALAMRKWTTWFEAPVTSAALFNSPELLDPLSQEGTAKWGIEDEEETEDEEGPEAEELGAFEDDLEDDGETATSSMNDDPDADEDEGTSKKAGWLTRQNSKRREKQEDRIKANTPFYLRTVGNGMVPALEIVLRRVYAALQHDEAPRRFAAADAVIVLVQAKLRGHTRQDQERLRRARSAHYERARRRRSSKALVAYDPALGGGASGDDEENPFESLVSTLKSMIDEDESLYVRGRSAVALLYVLTSGAGYKTLEGYMQNMSESERAISEQSIFATYFRSFVTDDRLGRGVGLRLMSEVIDHLVYELLDHAPEMAPSAVDLAELWAMTHPTVGVCGRLGALWEKALEVGAGEAVGASLFRAMNVKPHAERVACAAAAFLRRRTLDLAVITIGSSHLAGSAVPEPLPDAIRVEIERYFSLLWHAALLGPSAECRVLAVEALGGAAALAGDPLRVSTYERLVELVRIRGLGLKIPAENALDCLDVLYSARERFSEARHQNGIARDGSDMSSAWLQLVWRLAAEASSAAQILLGVPPPTGWQPLGPGGAADLANAERAYGDVRDRQEAKLLKNPGVAREAAPAVAPTLQLEAPPGDRGGRMEDAFAYAPRGFRHGNDVDGYSDDDYDGRRRSPGYSDDSDDGVRRRRSRDYDDRYDRYDRYDDRGTYSRHEEEERHRRYSDDDVDRYTTSGRGGQEGGNRRSSEAVPGELSRRTPFDDESRGSSSSRTQQGRGNISGSRASDRNGSYDEESEWDEQQGRRLLGSASARNLSAVRDSLQEAGRRATEVVSGRDQEQRDRNLARRLQAEEDERSQGSRFSRPSDARILSAASSAASYAPQSAAKFVRGGLRSGAGLAGKAGKLAKGMTGSRSGGDS